jgi:hypothetical protein
MTRRRTKCRTSGGKARNFLNGGLVSDPLPQSKESSQQFKKIRTPLWVQAVEEEFNNMEEDGVFQPIDMSLVPPEPRYYLPLGC